MLDRYNRHINYLRISVTDRCNLRCVYCMPAEGIKLMSHDDILSFDEILEVVKEAARLGINKIRITGGEPLVRKNVVKLVEMISQVEGINDLSMTTNAIILDKYAEDLAKAGLQRVNISLDTLDPIKYAKLTRGGDVNLVLKGISSAKKAGLTAVKINCVVEKSADELDARQVSAFCKANDIQCRFIRKMDLSKGKYWKVQGGDGGDCSICNRLRLTSNGMLKPCLFNNQEINVRELGVKKAIELAVSLKPKCGTLNHSSQFHNIGG